MPRVVSDLKSGEPIVLGSPGTYVLDTVSVDEYGSVQWSVTLVGPTGDRSNLQIAAVHNGTSTADATTGSYTEFARVYTARNVDNKAIFEVVLTGTGVSQVMELRVTTTTIAFSFAYAFRHPLCTNGLQP